MSENRIPNPLPENPHVYNDSEVGRVKIKEKNGKFICQLLDYGVGSLLISRENAEAWLEKTISEYSNYEEEEEAGEELQPCPVCETGEAYPLGTLGSYSYYRCQNCGSQFSFVNASHLE